MDISKVSRNGLELESVFEWLGAETPKSFKADTYRRILGSVDGGSTRTHVALMDVDDVNSSLDQAISEIRVIPSVSSVVVDDRTLPTESNALWDQMDSRIENLSGDAPFKSVRLIRGSKQFNEEFAESRIGSTTLKVDDAAYYYNLLDGLGLSLIGKYGSEAPAVVDLWLALSLPPDDTSQKNADTLRGKLKSYRWSHISGYSVVINIKAVHIMTEPEAFVKAHYMLEDKDVPRNILHIEGGGRSIGVEILVKGRSLKQAQVSLDFGGTQLLDDLNSLFNSVHGGRALPRQVLEEAIQTGTVRKIPVVDLIAQAKDGYADKIIVKIMQRVFDTQTRVTLEDLDAISFSGRMFGKGEYDYSISTPLQKLFISKGVQPDVEFNTMEGNLIPVGLLIDGFLEFFDSDDEGDSESMPSSDASQEINAEYTTAGPADGIQQVPVGDTTATIPSGEVSSNQGGGATAEISAALNQAASSAE